MMCYSIERRTRKCIKGYGFLPFARNLSGKCGKKLLDTAIKTVSEKVFYKADEATGELIGNRIIDKIVKPKPAPDANLRNAEKIVIPPEKRPEILNKLRQAL